jgi:hypothetical protein
VTRVGDGERSRPSFKWRETDAQQVGRCERRALRTFRLRWGVSTREGKLRKRQVTGEQVRDSGRRDDHQSTASPHRRLESDICAEGRT